MARRLCPWILSLGGEVDDDRFYIRLDAACTFCVNADLDYLDVATAGKLASLDRYYSADRHFLFHC